MLVVLSDLKRIDDIFVERKDLSVQKDELILIYTTSDSKVRINIKRTGKIEKSRNTVAKKTSDNSKK